MGLRGSTPQFWLTPQTSPAIFIFQAYHNFIPLILTEEYFYTFSPLLIILFLVDPDGVNNEAIFMAALWNKAGHYIFALWFLSKFLSFFFFSPNLSARRLDGYHTSTHGVALVRI